MHRPLLLLATLAFPSLVAAAEPLRLVHGTAVLSVACSPDGKLALSGASDGSLVLWQLPEGRERLRLPLATHGLSDLAFAGERLVALTPETAYVLDRASGRELRRLGLPGGQLVDLAADAAERWLAVGSRLGELGVWALADGSPLSRSRPADGPLLGLAFAPGGTQLLSAWADGRARTLSPASGAEIASFAIPSSNDAVVTFSADGTTLFASGGRTPSLCAWRVHGGKELDCLGSEPVWPTSLATSADGRLVAWGTPDGQVILWDTPRGQRRSALTLGSLAYGLAFCGDAASPGPLVIGTEDGIVRIWAFAR
jgi:WD40 repeat protein